MPVYDENTGEAATYTSSEKLTSDYKEGLYNFGDQKRVNVFRPSGGTRKMMNIPVESISQALEEGYLLESDMEKTGREWVASEEGQSLSTQAGVFGEELFDSLLFGAPAIAHKYTDNPLEAYKRKLIAEEHGLASGVGFGLGTALNLFATGGVGAGVKAVGAKASAKVAEKIMTKRIIARTAGNISQEAAEKGAQSIIKRIGKTVGGTAVLGAAEMTPAAMTEAYFGNTERAAELLGMGAVLGGGIGATFGAGSIAAKSTADAARKGISTVKESGIVQDAFVKAQASLSGVPEDVIRYASKHPDAVRNAVPANKMSATINEARETEIDFYNLDKQNAADADELLKSNEKLFTKEMSDRANAPSEVFADRIETDIAHTQEYMGIVSEQADDMLEAAIPDAIIPKKSLTTSIHMQISRLRKLPGEADEAVANRLAKSVDRINKVYDGKTHLTGKEARDALRSLRTDIKFGQGVGEFDATWDKAMKKVTGSFSKRLKKTKGAEGYVKAMDDIAPKAKALKIFAKEMKSRTARLNMARIMSKPNLSAGEKAKLEAFEQFLGELDNASPGIRGQYEELAVGQRQANIYMEDVKKLRNSMSKDKRRQFDEKYFEKEHRAKLDAEETFLQREASMKEIKPAMGGLTGDHFTAKKLGKLFREEGDEIHDEAVRSFFFRNNIDYDQAKASYMADQLTKARPAGSKYVNTFGTLGFLGGGGVLGAAVGAVVGAGVDRYGGAAIREMTTGKMATWLRAEDYMSKIATKMDLIPKVLKKGTSERAQENMLRTGIKIYRDVIKEVPAADRKRYGITDDKPTAENIESRKYQVNLWKAMTYRFDQYEQNPSKLISEIEEKTEVVSGDEALQSAMAQTIIKATAYLQDEIPKDPTVDDIFTATEDRWEPNDYDVDVFTQKVIAVQDPIVIVEALLSDNLTRNMTDAVAVSSPNILEMVQGKMAEAIAESPEDFDYTRRLSASYIMNVPLERTATPESYLYYQNIFKGQQEAEQQQAQQQAPAPAAGDFKPRLKTKPNDGLSKASRLANNIYS